MMALASAETRRIGGGGLLKPRHGGAAGPCSEHPHGRVGSGSTLRARLLFEQWCGWLAMVSRRLRPGGATLLPQVLLLPRAFPPRLCPGAQMSGEVM